MRRSPRARPIIRTDAEEYLFYCRYTVVPVSHKMYRTVIRHFVAYQKQNPGPICRSYITRYLMHLSTDRGYVTVSQYRDKLRTYFKWLIDNDRYAGPNPVGKTVGIPTPKERRVFTPAEYERLKDAALLVKHGQLWLGAIILAWHTGFRLQDVARLQKKSVDLNERSLHIVPWKTLRTGKSVTIPMGDELCAAMGRAILRTTANVPGVFPEFAHCYYRGALSMQFRQIADLAGVEGTFHCFRHSFVTRAVAAGVHPLVICSFTGHSLAMVQRYSHPTMEVKRENMERMVG